ncbi:MAG: hypothetical protein R3B06_29650 [Kofleriaceae bacterium]
MTGTGVVAVAVAALVALAACSRDAPAGRGPAPRAAASAPSSDGGLDGGSPCVEACVRDRQMVATSIEAIVADCERACGATP